MTTRAIPRWARVGLVAFLALAVFVVVFRLGSQSSAGVTLSDPVVWVEDGARGRILQINGSTREVTAAVEVTENGSDLLSALPNGRDAVFVNRSAAEFGSIGAVSLDVSDRTDVGLTSNQLEDAEFLGVVEPESGRHSSYVVSSAGVLIFTAGATEPLNIPISGGLGDVVTEPSGQLVAATADSTQLLITNNSGGDDSGLVFLADLPERLSEDDVPVSLVRAGEAVYVIDGSRRTVQEVDLESGDFGNATSICGSLDDAGIAGNALTESDGLHRILIHDADDGVLSVAEPANGACSEIALSQSGQNFGPPVAVDNTAYLPNYETGEVVVVDLDDRVVVRSHAFTPVRDREFELEVFDGVVWANEPNGVRAAVISEEQIVPISKQQRIRVVGVGADGNEAIGANGDGSDDADGQRVFGSGGDVFEGFNGGDGDPVAGDDLAATEGDGASADGSGSGDGDAPIDGELISGDVAELVNAPIVVEAAELEASGENLIANFSFSTDVLTAGEEVRLEDDSTGEPTQWNWDFGDGTGEVGPEVTKAWEVEGVYTVTMTIVNEAGEEAFQVHDFTVVAPDVDLPPSADFTFESDTIEVGEPLQFTSTSTGNPDTLFWTFGDDKTDSGETVTTVFDTAGVFVVTLTATNASGSDVERAQITVVEGGTPPEAVIGNTPLTVETGQSVLLLSESTNSPTSTVWDFGDGTTGFGDSVRHSWDDPGEFEIRLTVSNSTGEDSVTRSIFVEPAIDPPIAAFGQSGLQVIAGETLNFTDQSRNNPTSLLWEFGDGTTATASNVSNSWVEPGTYTVTLTATNEAGSDSTAKTVTVIPVPVDPPVAGFQPSSGVVSVGELVGFTDTSTGDPTEWRWNFGDGLPTEDSVAQSPVHAFGVPGEYTVTLRASNEGGSSSFSRTIIVIDPPVARFTQVIDELTVSFSDASTNAPTEWFWSFGNGETQSGPGLTSPTINYDQAGSYEVSLVVSNAAGSSTPFTTVIEVAEVPDADFSVTTNGLTAFFTDESDDGPTSWSWNFGDGVTVAEPTQNPTYTYDQPGNYTVTLTASNIAGSDQRSIVVPVTVAAPDARASCTVVTGTATVTCNGFGSSGAASYVWSAPEAVTGDGATGDEATFTFPGNGDYEIELTVDNGFGDTDSDSDDVTITLPTPEVTAINVVSDNGAGGLGLAGTATNNPDDWNWTVDNGGSITGAGASVTLNVPAPGAYTVTATAANDNGTSPEFDRTITVAFAPTVSNVQQSENSPGAVTLSATAANGPVTWLWTAPGSNEGTSTSPTPTFTYDANGSYPNTTVQVTNSAGSDDASFTVVVSDIVPPLVTITSAGLSGTGTIEAAATSPNGTISWSVSPATTPSSATSTSGGVVSFTPSPSAAAVTYTVTATVTGTSGAQASDSRDVTVPAVPAPNASFTASANPAPVGALVTFTGVAQPGATFAWDFGNGMSSMTPTSAATAYLLPGPYVVTLTVTNSVGVAATTTLAMTITP